jgi:hypothetical protein
VLCNCKYIMPYYYKSIVSHKYKYIMLCNILTCFLSISCCNVPHRKPRNVRAERELYLGPGVARGFACLEVEGAARASRTTRRCARGPRSDPQDVPAESRLGCTPHPRRATGTRHRHRGEQCEQIYGALPQAAVSHLAHIPGESCPAVSIDFFSVATIRFHVLYVFWYWPMIGVAFCIST